ncbi:MAG: ATPase, T2SS/T4P/T4SS family [Phycisphaerales bacterium]|nr:ATPase, T2SS/T4P/T4SS family [Phycisphaerales bacterium]
MARKRKKLGEILRERKFATKETLTQGLEISHGSGKRLGEAMVEAGLLDESNLAEALAEQFGMEYVDLNSDDIESRCDMSLVPGDMVKKHLIVPMEKVSGRMKLVVHDPMDLELLDLLRFRLNCEIDTAVSSKSQLREFIEGVNAAEGQAGDGGSLFGGQESLVTDSVDVTMDRSVDTSVDASVDIAAGDGDDAPIIRLVTRLITEAVRTRASDIHVEPMNDRVLLRYRIDGVCHVRDNLPKRMQQAMLARLKLMAGVNIAERRIPQDGRIKMTVDEDVVDFRVSVCPAYHGESVVLRILRPDSVRIGLENLGFESDHLQTFNKIIRRPNGIFLVTGPTGSGKTTTLYSALDILNRPDRKIITAEDPIEYSFAGINQCQVREQIGLSFSWILKSMLRQAPNIILIGEIRDREVADIAIQAALTGHLVFSTLHTNDAPSAMTRLIDMGVKPYLVASSIQAVMAQRLFRVLCDHCKEPDTDVPPKVAELVGLEPEDLRSGAICKPVGCAKCGKIGFRGRRALFELMKLNTEIRELAFQQGTVGDIRAAAIRSGMRELVEDGKMKILRGETTPVEVARFAQADSLLEANIDV